jgi:hypothetical protein
LTEILVKGAYVRGSFMQRLPYNDLVTYEVRNKNKNKNKNKRIFFSFCKKKKKEEEKTSKSSMDPRQCIVKQCKNRSNIIIKLSKRNSK